MGLFSEFLRYTIIEAKQGISKGYSYLLSVKVLLVLSVVMSYKCKHVNLLLKLSRIMMYTIRYEVESKGAYG